MDIADGHLVPPRIVDGAENLVGTHERSVWVEAGGSLEVVLGVLQGALHFEAGSQGVIIGAVQGSLTVAPDASVVLRGGNKGRSPAPSEAR